MKGRTATARANAEACRSAHAAAARLQVVCLATLSFAWKGYQFSWQFERGQKWDGYAPGLQQGLLGRRVVSGD